MKFELAFRPGQRLLHGFALRAAQTHQPGGGRTIDSYRQSASCAACSPQLFSDLANGRMRIRLPVALNIALATAGPIGGTPGSPTPVGAAEELMM
jgi:hypothetical protein